MTLEVCSGCGEGSGAGASIAGASSLGVVLAVGAIVAWLAISTALDVVDIFGSWVAAGSWLLRRDRDGVASAL